MHIVGHFREPEAFLKAAMECTHPVDIMYSTSDATKRALFSLLTMGPEAITSLYEWPLCRCRTIRQELVKEAGYDDGGLHSLLIHGTKLTGTTISSGQLYKHWHRLGVCKLVQHFTTAELGSCGNDSVLARRSLPQQSWADLQIFQSCSNRVAVLEEQSSKQV